MAIDITYPRQRVPMVNAAPSTRFFDTLGFEMGLVFTTAHGHTEGWAEIQRLVSQHDKPGVHDLLVTIGGPDDTGFCFLTEEAFADFLLRAPVSLSTPNHIQRVIMHFWSQGRILEVYPTLRVMCAGAYPLGFALPHHVGTPTAAAESWAAAADSSHQTQNTELKDADKRPT